ncbi:hypothetical protein Tco_0424797 [Tanacetum coccineum]
MCYIVGIEPQFNNILLNGPYVPMTAGQRKPEGQWTGDDRKAANVDQRLKSFILSILPDDQMNSVINCEIAKSTWEDLILYHEGPSNVKENVSLDDSEMVEVKVLMALADDENAVVGKESARNGA